MKIPDEARLTPMEIKPFNRFDPDFEGLCTAQLAKAAPIIEALARKEERERFLRILEGLLPINSDGRCVLCECGNKPDAEGYHSDSDNIWRGDQRCLQHEFYRDALELWQYHKVTLKEGK